MILELYMIQKVVEDYFGFGINKKSRRRHLVDARRMYFRLAREFTNYSLHRLGYSMDRDHATALFAIKTCKDLCRSDKEFRLKYLTLRRKLEELKSLSYKKTIYTVPKHIHPGRLRYGKNKSIREVFNKGGQITKQRYKIY